MHITVLGGAGKMGCISVQTLAGDSRVESVVIADKNEAQAKIVADYITSPKVSFQPIDLEAKDELEALLKHSDVCLNATLYYTNLAVMEACLKSGTHYTDMGGLFHTTRKQLEMSDRFSEAGISAVLCMGSAPGVPNIQTRYAADRLDTIESINIFDGIKPPSGEVLKFPYAVPTILDELIIEPMVFEDGQFKAKEPLSEFEEYQFTEPVGLLPVHLSLHSEVATLPISFESKGVKQCTFKINYWGMAKEAVEKIRVLTDLGFASDKSVDIKGSGVVPRDLMEILLADAVPDIKEYLAPPATQPPNWTKEIVTEVRGSKDGDEVTYRLGTLTCKGALPTGASPALAAIWLASGKIEPGVHPPELALDPVPFFEELKAYDIYTDVSVSRRL